MAERIHWCTERWLMSPLFLSLSLIFYLPTYLPAYLPTYLPIYLLYLSIYLSIDLSLSLSSVDLTICLPIYLSIYLQAWKRSYSARFAQFSNLTTAKTQQFSETSSIFAFDNIKNEALLRDFLFAFKFTTSKAKNSARRPSKMESCVQSWRPRTNAFCDFPSPFV